MKTLKLIFLLHTTLVSGRDSVSLPLYLEWDAPETGAELVSVYNVERKVGMIWLWETATPFQQHPISLEPGKYQFRVKASGNDTESLFSEPLDVDVKEVILEISPDGVVWKTEVGIAVLEDAPQQFYRIKYP